MQTKGEYTPGPWHADPADMFGDHNIMRGDNEDVLAIAAVVWNMRPSDEVAANARLIAAAPEMLEALTNLLTETELPYGTMLRDRQDEARTAIARAKGLPS